MEIIIKLDESTMELYKASVSSGDWKDFEQSVMPKIYEAITGGVTGIEPLITRRDALCILWGFGLGQSCGKELAKDFVLAVAALIGAKSKEARLELGKEAETFVKDTILPLLLYTLDKEPSH